MNVRICSMIRGEQKYFDHWKRWHEGKGFKITLYIDDPAERELYDCDDKRDVISFRDDKKSWLRQIDSMNDYLLSLKDEEGWALLIDIDEYCFFTADEFLKVAEFNKDSRVIRLPQKVYIADGEKYREKFAGKPVTERFTVPSSADKYQFGKLAVKLGTDTGLSSIHIPSDGISTKETDRRGKGVRVAATYKCHLRHYLTKSREEWLQRGRNIPDEKSPEAVTNPTGVKYEALDFERYNELV